MSKEINEYTTNNNQMATTLLNKWLNDADDSLRKDGYTEDEIKALTNEMTTVPLSAEENAFVSELKEMIDQLKASENNSFLTS